MLQVAQLEHLQIWQVYNAKLALHHVLSVVLKEQTVLLVLQIIFLFLHLMIVFKVVQMECILKMINFASAV